MSKGTDNEAECIVSPSFVFCFSATNDSVPAKHPLTFWYSDWHLEYEYLSHPRQFPMLFTALKTEGYSDPLYWNKQAILWNPRVKYEYYWKRKTCEVLSSHTYPFKHTHLGYMCNKNHTVDSIKKILPPKKNQVNQLSAGTDWTFADTQQYFTAHTIFF